LLIVLLAMSPNFAHAAGHCERPAKPGFPDPATVEPAVAEKLDGAMQKYAAGMAAYIQCLGKETEEAQQEATETIDAYNQKFLPEYNKRAAGQ
jgi:hypothetical protein